MWTLMPWLYQLQQRSGEGVVYASLLIAAIPTFIIFSLCQNVIMRGIVVPVKGGVKVVTKAADLKPGEMVDNWLVLLAKEGVPEIPAIVVFQRRPEPAARPGLLRDHRLPGLLLRVERPERRALPELILGRADRIQLREQFHQRG